MFRFRILVSLLLLQALLAIGTDVVTVRDGNPRAAFATDDQDQNGNSEKPDKDKDKEKKDKHKNKVTPAAPYLVEVNCMYDSSANESFCSFTGIAPAGAKNVGHLDLPVSEVCTEVIGGDYEYVDPDPNTRVIGYKSRGNEGVFTLILRGEVTTGGTTTYWFKTGDGAFPAIGPGLVCGDESGQSGDESTYTADGTAETASTMPTSTMTATGEAAESEIGRIAVALYTCPEKPATSDYDWYSLCEPGLEEVALNLSIQEESGYAPIAEGITGSDGEFLFEGLAPGTYHLEAPATVWCHAESDNVDDQGDLVVEAGAEVSVWIFVCPDDPAA